MAYATIYLLSYARTQFYIKITYVSLLFIHPIATLLLHYVRGDTKVWTNRKMIIEAKLQHINTQVATYIVYVGNTYVVLRSVFVNAVHPEDPPAESHGLYHL